MLGSGPAGRAGGAAGDPGGPDAEYDQAVPGRVAAAEGIEQGLAAGESGRCRHSSQSTPSPTAPPTGTGSRIVGSPATAPLPEGLFGSLRIDSHFRGVPMARDRL